MAPDLVAHGGVREVEHDLRAAAARPHRAALLLKRPVRVRREEVAAAEVRHLGLDPEAELEPALLRLAGERAEAVRELRLVDVPVAEAAVVGVARVRAAPEPAVVEHEHLHADRLGAVHDLVQLRLGEREERALPVVEQRRARLRAGRHPVTARPAVEVARNLPLALLRPRERGDGEGDRPAGVEDVVARDVRRAADRLQQVDLAAPQRDLPRAGPAERAAEDAALRLGRGTADREHERRVVQPGVAHAGARIEDDAPAARERRLDDLRLAAPLAREAQQAPVVREQREHEREGRHARDSDRPLLAVRELGPGFDHVRVRPRPEGLHDPEVVDRVAPVHDEPAAAALQLLDDEVERLRSVGVRDLEPAEAVQPAAGLAEGRIGERPLGAEPAVDAGAGAAGERERGVRVRDLRPEVAQVEAVARARALQFEEHRGVVGLDRECLRGGGVDGFRGAGGAGLFFHGGLGGWGWRQ